MCQAIFRFYAELNDFLPPSQQGYPQIYRFDNNPSVKDAIESLGIPHTEIDLILVNSESVDFTYGVQHQDRISVYPMFESFDITPLLRVRPQPLRETRFLLDVHLGKLAHYLRMLGFDALYRNDYEDAQLAQLSRQEKRILLTRDIGLLKRSLVTHGYFLRETNPKKQLPEVLRRFDLYRAITPFQHCITCNGLMQPIQKIEATQHLPVDTVQHYDSFYRCNHCGKIYWKGSHYKKMQEFIAEIKNSYLLNS
jgi:hypothetical protein